MRSRARIASGLLSHSYHESEPRGSVAHLRARLSGRTSQVECTTRAVRAIEADTRDSSPRVSEGKVQLNLRMV
ncbi:hypothetical protein RRG08_063263 [Elysia crispata]|uniref:Uncharacterized protein n=1 Tax=Elysia crispata TaxID=231223 RepID=A0AAE0XP78_9GAST|nr:hypothetical protein RRG08_063263 [Elysia crispata]